jgi:site-specific DNA-cytosine methylase
VPTFIDLFSGCGGFTLGMLRASDCATAKFAALRFALPAQWREHIALTLGKKIEIDFHAARGATTG